MPIYRLIKKHFIGLVAIATAMVLFAFNKSQRNISEPQWFVYFDGANDIADNVAEALDESNYRLLDGEPCAGPLKLCAIRSKPGAIQGEMLRPKNIESQRELYRAIRDYIIFGIDNPKYISEKY